MNISARLSSNWRSFALAFGLLTASGAVWAGEWSEMKPALYRGDIIVTYRARVVGDWLVVEARHAPSWHTYAMDNLVRAQRASGKESPEVEAGTRFTVGGGLKTVGDWRQSPPQDLSNLDIQWFTWGFSNSARFAVKVERVSNEPGVVTINAQACSDALCSFVRDLAIEIPTGETSDETKSAAALPEGLVELTTAPTPAPARNPN